MRFLLSHINNLNSTEDNFRILPRATLTNPGAFDAEAKLHFTFAKAVRHIDSGIQIIKNPFQINHMSYAVLLGCNYNCGFATIFMLKKKMYTIFFLSLSSFREIFAATAEVKTFS